MSFSHRSEFIVSSFRTQAKEKEQHFGSWEFFDRADVFGSSEENDALPAASENNEQRVHCSDAHLRFIKTKTLIPQSISAQKQFLLTTVTAATHQR